MCQPHVPTFVLHLNSVKTKNGEPFFLILPPLSHNIARIGFLKSQISQTLTKFIEKVIYIYNTKYIPYENIFQDESNVIDLVF